MKSSDPKRNEIRRNRPKRRPKSTKSDLRHFTSIDKYKSILDASLEESEYVIFDIETTGGNPEKNGMTEFCGLRIVNGEIVESFDTLINPEIPIPPIVRKMTGINDRMVRNSPKIKEVMPQILDFIKDRIVVSHNTIGDLKFIRYFAKEVCDVTFDNFFICTHLLSEKYLSESPDKSLKGLATFMDVKFEGAHRAEADAVITWKLFQEISRRAQKDGVHLVKQIIRKQGDYESSFRLGWGVPNSEIQALPNSVGVYQGFDLKGQVIFCSSAMNLKREVSELRKYSELPKPMLRKVFSTYSIKANKHENFLDALKHVATVNRKHGLTPIGSFVNQRRLITFYFDKTSEGEWYLATGQPPETARFVLGPVFDRKVAGAYLDRIADCLDLEIRRSKLILNENQVIPIYGYLCSCLESFSLDVKSKISGFVSLFSKSHRDKWRYIQENLLKLSELPLNHPYCDLAILEGDFSFFTDAHELRCKLVNSKLDIRQKGPKSEGLERKKLDADMLKNLPLNTLNRKVSKASIGISEFEVWEFVSWCIFSNRGRKYCEFKPNPKSLKSPI